MSDLPELIPLSDDEFWRYSLLYGENEKSAEEELQRYLAEGREELFAPPRKRKSVVSVKRARDGSLRDWAIALNKDPRQIRRYCELGLIPGASRTSGGHWRAKLSPRALRQAKKNLEGKTRQFDRLKESDFARAMRNAPPPLEDLWEPEAALRMGGITHDIAAAMVRVYKKMDVTQRAVAKEMGVHRSTLARMLKKMPKGYFRNWAQKLEQVGKYYAHFGKTEELPAKPKNTSNNCWNNSWSNFNT